MTWRRRATARSGSRRRRPASSVGSTRGPAASDACGSGAGRPPPGGAWGLAPPPAGAPGGGLTAIVRVDARLLRVRRFPLPRDRAAANLNTATFDHRRRLWFTGQAGIYGRLDPRSGRMRVFDAPRGPGPYGISTTPAGEV